MGAPNTLVFLKTPFKNLRLRSFKSMFASTRVKRNSDVEERGLFATGAGTFGGVADLDCMASITSKMTSSATNTA